MLSVSVADVCRVLFAVWWCSCALLIAVERCCLLFGICL